MRILLILLAVVGALVAAGFYLLPLLIAHGPAVLGFLGAVLLVIAAVIPRRKPTCRGHHCPGCDH
ncbi:hypothetical protein Aca07nite_19440 [Actinoplanes capillaceus]|uniref:PEP-CTERM protein-sorting domain-containing protein n=1 Tax=Actinoplanes campanulatus TaxID=113559 RepID=A0ABQ3WCB1_9ACTN|nr:hypothetical protein [Actinoplanes capillaceus]GID44669.1 hypothetical protein Aca07nite_19440 [Actinoplanes capillaceus]